jgi:hypothetical protein
MSRHEKPIEGGKDEWLTPPWLLDTFGPFDLDPCAPRKSIRPWPTAKRHYSIKQDGLAQKWRGFVWMNPPYGRVTGVWLEKLADHGDGIALIFARTETEMFRKQVWERADAVLFLYGRIRFHHVDGSVGHSNAGAPSCLVGYGPKAVKRLKRRGRNHGKLVLL